MPYDVIEKTTVGRLNVGARLTDYGDQVVRDIRRKVKYAFVDIAPSRDSDDVMTDLRWNLDQVVRITVNKLTDAEQFDRDHERAQIWEREEMTENLNRVPADVLTKLAQSWRDGPVKGDVLDWSDAATFFKIQARYRMWRTIDHALAQLRELYGDQVTELSAIVLETHNLEKDRRNRSVLDPLSRSTSVFSNVIDDLNRYVWDELVDTMRYRVSDAIKAYELSRLRELAATRKAAAATER